MRHLSIPILSLFILFGCVRADLEEPAPMPEEQTRSLSADTSLYSHYYWFDGRKIPLTPTKKCYKLIRVSKNDKAPTLSGKALCKHPYSAKIDSLGSIYVATTDGTAKTAFSADTKEIYSIPVFRDNQDNEIKISNLFYVILEKASDEAFLRQLAHENNVIFLGEDSEIPLWYTLACTSVSRGNALEMANRFEETGKFRAVSPHFVGGWTVASNDPYYKDQWSLNNTGQTVVSGWPWNAVYNATPGVDIGYKELEPYVTDASEVIVAVIDVGVDHGHPDLNAYQCYDATSSLSPGFIYGEEKYEKFHGTNCAGIIGAISNNDIGIAGIAPNARIMGIAVNFYVENFGEVEKYVASAIQYAIRKGASVISNSWGGPPMSNTVVEKYKDALKYGRNGKGCVIVCSSGNSNEKNKNYFPGGANPEFICVGAHDPNGNRGVEYQSGGKVWGSNYGDALDIVAPGTGIFTTANRPEEYIGDFGCTSAACPHVAGVAALMLAYNPQLTQKEVKDIIESTATRIGSYQYTASPAHPNGIWNEEVGYGMLNAYGAVMAAIPPLVVSDQIISNTTSYTRQNLTFNRVGVTESASLDVKSIVDYIKFNTVSVQDKASVTAESKQRTEFRNFTVSGTAKVSSASEGTATLERVEVKDKGRFLASASDFRINSSFRVEKGGEFRLEIAGE